MRKEKAAHQIQGGMRGFFLNLAAGTAKVEQMVTDLALVTQSQIHRADRLCCAAAGWPGNTGCGNGDIALQAINRSTRQGPGCFGADRAMPLQKHWGNPQQGLL